MESGGSTDRPETIFFGFYMRKLGSSQFFSLIGLFLAKILGSKGFRACFGPTVKNLTCAIQSVIPIGHFSFILFLSTIFMQKIRGLTHVSKNFSEFQKWSFLPYKAKIHQLPFRSSQYPHARYFIFFFKILKIEGQDYFFTEFRPQNRIFWVI